MAQSQPAAAGRKETPVGLAWVVVAAGLCGFLAMAAAARNLVPHGFDTALLLGLREPGQLEQPIGPAWLPGMVRDVTALGSTVLLTYITVAGTIFLWLVRARAKALHLLIAMAGGQALASIAKFVVHRPRPEIVPHLVSETSLSFPSGHAMMSAIAYLTLAMLAATAVASRAGRILLLGLAVLTTLAVGASRVYLGVHWPSDVLAGWCAGFAWAMLCWLAARLLQRRRTVGEGE